MDQATFTSSLNIIPTFNFGVDEIFRESSEPSSSENVTNISDNDIQAYFE